MSGTEATDTSRSRDTGWPRYRKYNLVSGLILAAMTAGTLSDSLTDSLEDGPLSTWRTVVQVLLFLALAVLVIGVVPASRARPTRFLPRVGAVAMILGTATYALSGAWVQGIAALVIAGILAAVLADGWWDRAFRWPLDSPE